MNVPSYEALLDKERLLKVIRELCEKVNALENNSATIKEGIEVISNGDVYISGVGGYDGTNAGEDNILTLQEILEDLAE